MKTWQLFMVYLLTHTLFFLTSIYSQSTSKQSSNYGADLPVLLSFKSLITSDPTEALSSWSWDPVINDTSMAPLPDYCEWTGVACSNRRHPGHVTAIRLHRLSLAGSISPQLGNLTRLRVLGLSANNLQEALEYLHHRIEPSIVHCDIKPCNILLDDEIVAHVIDFGLAKIMHTDECMHSGGGTESSSLVINGTIGYVAPKYGSGAEPSTDGDIYSYGVLILEIFTGRRPTDNFMDGVTSLVNYVRMAYPDKLLEILDASATYSGDTQRIIDTFLYPMFKLGLACCEDSPRHRMKINDVVKELNTTKRACADHMAVQKYPATD